MSNKNTARFVGRLAALTATVILAGCYGNADSGQAAGRAGTPVRAITGTVVKGPLDAATVRLYPVGIRGERAGPLLAEAVTDAAGNWSTTVPATAAPLLVVSSGGRYIDEADPEPDPARRRAVTLGADDQFSALLPADAATVSVNIFTDALLRKSRHEAEGANFHTVFAINRGFLADAFGFDLLTTMPADPIQPSGAATQNARQYAMALGGIANVVNAYAVASGQHIADFATISAVIDDMTDCTINGRGVAGPVTDVEIAGGKLNDQILRFRNNNFAAYDDTPLLVITEAGCARSGRMADTIAPVFEVVPPDFTVAASDATGIAATAAAVQTVLATARARDDRDGPVSPAFDLPPTLPLGVTTVAIRAVDAAGNASVVFVAITVTDQESPTITAPPDIDVTAAGALTVVALGDPIVADNVTPAGALVVTNDAPPDGFGPGTHVVTWQVTDAAGLVASAVQTVVVRTAPPVLVMPVPAIGATEGEPFSEDLSPGFADADSTLTFKLTGLPPGTGLSLSVAGVLAGTPTDADAQASPLMLTVRASDETSFIDSGFTLTVADVNNSPSFTVSGDLALEEDFTGTVMVEIFPDPVPAGDPDDVVYTLVDVDADFVNLSIDSGTGQVRVTSRADANGSGSFTIRADDGATINNLYSRPVLVSVAAVNDPPVFSLSGNIEVVPGFTGTALVTALADAVPDDERAQPVSYSIEHSIAFATIGLDSATGEVSVSDVAALEVTALIAVTADDGQSENATHTELFSLVVRERNKVVYVAVPVDDPFPVLPVFPRSHERPVGFGAAGLPTSLSVHPSTGRLTGTPTESDGELGIANVTYTVTGSHGTSAAIDQVLRIEELDIDLDGLSDRLEAVHETDPAHPDTDGDGLSDGLEVEIGSDALVAAGSITTLQPEDLATGLVLSATGATARDPAVYLLPAGKFEASLSLQAPCDHIVVVGALPREHVGKATDATTLSSEKGPLVSAAGCDNARLHYLRFTGSRTAPALQVQRSSLTVGNVGIYRNPGGALAIVDSHAIVDASVLSGNGGATAAIAVGDNSLLELADSVIRGSDSRPAVSLSGSGRLELQRMHDAVSVTGAGGVRYARGHHEALPHIPTLVKLRQNADGTHLATLEYKGTDLGQGYPLRASRSGVKIDVDDLNFGNYLIATDEIGADIIFSINGNSIPFLVEPESSD